MARIDSILSMVAQQGANELRVGTDREPKMLAYGAPKRLALPATPEEALRQLLGEILSDERDLAMRAGERLEVLHDAGAAGPFLVTLAARKGEPGFDAVFVRGGARGARRPAAVEPAPAIEPAPAPAGDEPAPPPEQAAVVAGPRLTALLARAAAMQASDLHLADGEPPCVRVDGALARLGDEAAIDVGSIVLPDAASRERVRLGRSVDLGMEVPGVGRVRANVYLAAQGLVAALRLLPRAAPSLASLHMPVPLEELVLLPHGLVLVCGATGSGKSTTLAALAQEALRRRSILLLTLEDPVEYALVPPETSLVRRRQIGRDAKDFASGLRDALREDPDVLLVGEMRDPETIGLALTAAETGHLVLASMHSRSSASAIERIVDAYPPERQGQIRVQLADALRAVVAQRLVPRAGGPGRVPAIELLRVTHAVASVIREGKTAQLGTLLQSGRRDGMISLERSLADRVEAGAIRLEDARAAANDPSSLAMYLSRGSP